MGMGVHVSSCNTTGFSSIQTTGSVVDNGLSYNPSTSSMRAMYSSSSFATVAVGTAIAGRPPHRSVRAELPHTAPALDASACHQGRRPTHCSWYLETRNPALSPARSHTRAILLGVRPSLHHLRSACPFGAARIVGNFIGTMADSDSSRSDARVVRHEPSPAGLFARLRWLLANLEVSRSEEHTSELQSL